MIREFCAHDQVSDSVPVDIGAGGHGRTQVISGDGSVGLCSSDGVAAVRVPRLGATDHEDDALDHAPICVGGWLCNDDFSVSVPV
jgi:threonine dehydrogenase-like Zn-dependent dehydrogenase